MRYLPYLDLTRLNENDTDASTQALCEKAMAVDGGIAAVCIQPHCVSAARAYLKNAPIKLASVANFPSGEAGLEHTLEHIKNIIHQGADEIDVVMPYTHYLAGDKNYVFSFLNACRESCSNKTLKVILETGALITHSNIVDAATIAIECGANFIKTSTGKIKKGATIEAVKAMLVAIQAQPQQNVGIKISGGIRSIEIAEDYYRLIEKTMGNDWITPETFRIGSSGLLDEILTKK
jgi:deoxyribose-phosphate aldolase